VGSVASVIRFFKWLFALLLIAFVLSAAFDLYVTYSADKYIYSDPKRVPPKRVALLLGTSKYVAKGKKNWYYLYRIDAAVTLWKQGKVKKILVSGDNATRYYNEPARMQKDLIRAGVPKRAIILDYAGFRTLDSVVRANKVFGFNDFTIVSQRFHLERALFIARTKGIKAIGFEAKSFKGTKAAYKMMWREYLARIKAFLDLFILNKQPHFI